MDINQVNGSHTGVSLYARVSAFFRLFWLLLYKNTQLSTSIPPSIETRAREGIPIRLNTLKFRIPPGSGSARYACNQCKDTGWYIVRSGKKTHEGVPYEGAKKCHHPAECRGELYGTV